MNSDKIVWAAFILGLMIIIGLSQVDISVDVNVCESAKAPPIKRG